MSELAALSRIDLPDREDMNRRAQAALDMATDYPVADDESYQLAADELKAIKAKAKELEQKRVSITSHLLSAKKAIDDLFRVPQDRLAEAERRLKAAMLAYSEEVERKAEAARKEAEEAQRAAAQRAAEAERAAAQAGDAQAAMEAAVAAIDAQVQMVVSTPAAPKAAGVSVRKTVKARVTDKAAFVKFIAESSSLLELVDINESKLNQMAKALGGHLNYPGVEVFEEKTLAAARA